MTQTMQYIQPFSKGYLPAKAKESHSRLRLRFTLHLQHSKFKFLFSAVTQLAISDKDLWNLDVHNKKYQSDCSELQRWSCGK